MKEKIIELRKEGKTYNEIVKETGCSKSTVSFHCGEGQKDKSKKRLKNFRTKNVLSNRVYLFNNKKVRDASRDFQRREGTVNGKAVQSFTDKDVIKKFGEETICYLSGEKINLLKDLHYCFDHITPAAKGGSNKIENLGILHKVVNKMKNDLSVEEFIFWCKKIYLYSKKNKL